MIVLTGLTGYAAPDVPPAVREVVPEVRGEGTVLHPIPEVAEALHHARTSEAYRHKSQKAAKRHEGAFAPSLRFTPIALRLRLRATERRKAAPDVPPAVREAVPEVRGEGTAPHPIPEVAEAPHLTEALGCERVGPDGVAHAGGARRAQSRGDDYAIGQGEVLGVSP